MSSESKTTEPNFTLNCGSLEQKCCSDALQDLKISTKPAEISQKSSETQESDETSETSPKIESNEPMCRGRCKTVNPQNLSEDELRETRQNKRLLHNQRRSAAWQNRLRQEQYRANSYNKRPEEYYQRAVTIYTRSSKKVVAQDIYL